MCEESDTTMKQASTHSILAVDDDPVSLRLLERTVSALGYVVEAVDNAGDALSLLKTTRCDIVILDWQMPDIDGLELCRRIRATHGAAYTYILMLTGARTTEDGGMEEAVNAGVDDFLEKPLNRQIVAARLQVACRILDAFHEIRHLRGLLPICAYCKKIRKDNDYWEQIESYLAAHVGRDLTHAICPDCFARLLSPTDRA